MIHRPLRYALIAFYAYGTFVHIANMASLTGFDWPSAPVKWQVLDVVYLILDLVVVVGLLFRQRLGVTAVILAATSQILLYTLLRSWVLDVPQEILPSPEQQNYLNILVGFHAISISLVLASLAWWRFQSTERPS
ncbi:MAG: hypothetical protein AAFY34_05600 [Pseudomonadota bacterium]